MAYTVRYLDEGSGEPIVILPGGMNDPGDWKAVAARLTARFRVVRVHRRQYRTDQDFGRPVTMADEVEDVLAVTKEIGRPVLLVGHSSGAVLALEALVAAPERFAGAVLYEPPVVVGEPLGGEALERARAAVAAGKPGKALEIFLRDIVRMPAWLAVLARLAVLIVRTLRPRVARQIDDADAIDALGVRLDAYAQLQIPAVLLRGDRSPDHLRERTEALARVLPRVERVVVLPGQAHGANDRAPAKVARVIEDFAGKLFG
ncbi:alpha/beta fold hydrolase [Amycolatopsis sp. GM8]|uniref:alpha/beta fold hydrolase n=1 Tax=Amycolatopsis sp. GM8 TaxID=2896530 RepID=UPI001F31EE70|nr:alpha/beta hydrolase [Amycolatopsis sp. GM8]